MKVLQSDNLLFLVFQVLVMDLHKSFYFFLCLILVPIVDSKATEPDTLDLKTQVRATAPDTIFHNYFSQETFTSVFGVQKKEIDTLLNGFQKYEPYLFAQTLGNIGRAHKSYVYEPYTGSGFKVAQNVFSTYMPSYDEVSYYDVSSPFTELFYVIGSDKEQVFNVLHTQNINKRFNVATAYDVINSVGSFRRSRTNISSFRLKSHYTNPSGNYSVLGNIIFNKSHNNENGGLADIESYKQEVLRRDDMYDVRLSDAQNRLNDRGIYAKQFYSFNREKPTTDTLSDASPNIFNSRILHSIHIQRRSFIFEDMNPASGFHHMVFLDSNYTGDSLRYNIVSNKLGIEHVFLRNKKQQPLIHAALFLGHHYIDFGSFTSIYQDSVIAVPQERFYLNQLISEFKLTIIPTQNMMAEIRGHTVSCTYNKGDYNISANVRYAFSDNHQISLAASSGEHTPAHTDAEYYGNHFRWSYNFNKTQQTHLRIQHNYRRIKTELRASQITNYIYNDAYALPKQYSNPIQVWQGWVCKNFTFGGLHYDPKIIVQKSSHENMMPLPLFATHHSLYYGTYMFQEALYANFGIDFYYNTSYYAYDYMPTTRRFYLQNHTKTGNYPIFDVFINFKIKSARLFLKAHHINESFSGSNKYATPQYPYQGLSFKFGVSWMFRD